MEFGIHCLNLYCLVLYNTASTVELFVPIVSVVERRRLTWDHIIQHVDGEPSVLQTLDESAEGKVMLECAWKTITNGPKCHVRFQSKLNKGVCDPMQWKIERETTGTRFIYF